MLELAQAHKQDLMLRNSSSRLRSGIRLLRNSCKNLISPTSQRTSFFRTSMMMRTLMNKPFLLFKTHFKRLSTLKTRSTLINNYRNLIQEREEVELNRPQSPSQWVCEASGVSVILSKMNWEFLFKNHQKVLLTVALPLHVNQNLNMLFSKNDTERMMVS